MANEEKVCEWHIVKPGSLKCSEVADTKITNKKTLQTTNIM
jgi:hypothetical protein